MTGEIPRLVFDLLPPLLVALGASFHCAGMCGGFVIAAGAGTGRGTGLRLPGASQFLFHLGKTSSYLFLGAIAGFGGKWVSWGRPVLAQALGVCAGLFLLLLGARTLGLWPRRPDRKRLVPSPRPWVEVGRPLFALEGPLRPLGLGMLSGWLPCPLVYGFAARAAAAASPLEALLTMATLGLGTIPVLLVVAAAGHTLSPLLRGRLVRASGILLALLGLYTAWRGFASPPCCSPEGVRW